jgi:hypothetical protein
MWGASPPPPPPGSILLRCGKMNILNKKLFYALKFSSMESGKGGLRNGCDECAKRRYYCSVRKVEKKKRGWFETTSRIYEGVPKIVKTQYWNIGDVVIEEKQNNLLL